MSPYTESQTNIEQYKTLHIHNRKSYFRVLYAWQIRNLKQILYKKGFKINVSNPDVKLSGIKGCKYLNVNNPYP